MIGDYLSEMTRVGAGKVSRRAVLTAGLAAGGGLLLCISMPACLDVAQAAESADFAPNAFIRIGRDGSSR